MAFWVLDQLGGGGAPYPSCIRGSRDPGVGGQDSFFLSLHFFGAILSGGLMSQGLSIHLVCTVKINGNVLKKRDEPGFIEYP